MHQNTGPGQGDRSPWHPKRGDSHPLRTEEPLPPELCRSSMEQKSGLIRRIVFFYLNGFREMTVGRTLWKIIFIKLFVMFAVLKVFFFPNFLQTEFETDQERAEHVAEQLVRPASGTTH